MTRNLLRNSSICLLAASAFAASSASMRAQEAAPQSPATQCWKIVTPQASVAPYGLILLDQCTGKTWLLSKIVTHQKLPENPHEKAKPDTFTYRWRPIPKDDTGEPVFDMNPP
jgi:hypothetical protein